MEDHPGRINRKPHKTRFLHEKYLSPGDSFAFLYDTTGYVIEIDRIL